MMRLLHTLRQKVLALLCRHFPEFKYRMILKACGLECRKLQREFALGQSDRLLSGRGTGKTTAVILRLLMTDPEKGTDPVGILLCDPDFINDNKRRQKWYYDQYIHAARICEDAGVPVIRFPMQCFRWVVDAEYAKSRWERY